MPWPRPVPPDRVLEMKGAARRVQRPEVCDAAGREGPEEVRRQRRGPGSLLRQGGEQALPFTINLLLHSMGNYLFKHLLGSTTYHANQLLFDNIIMAAADTNNELHAQWVDRIQCRNRLYITINERDGAPDGIAHEDGEQQRRGSATTPGGWMPERPPTWT